MFSGLTYRPGLLLFSLLARGRNMSAKGYAVRYPVGYTASGTSGEAATDAGVRVTRWIVQIPAEQARTTGVIPLTADIRSYP